VRVEQSRQVDAPAQLLGEYSLDEVSPRQLRSGWIPFELDVREPGPGGDCAIRAHVDIDRDDAVSPGDYVTTEKIPVLSDRQQVPLRVTVELVPSR
jgi:hypothetical protein